MPLCIRCHREMGETPFCPHCGARQERNPKGKRTRANGTGTAYKRGQTWTAMVVLGYYQDDDGNQHRVSRTKGGFKTKTAALEYCALLKSQKEKACAPLLQEYWRTYSTTDMDRLSNSKYTAYTIAWNKLKKLHARPVDQITVAELRSVVGKVCTTYYTAKDAKSVLMHLFNLAGADGNANKDLPTYINLPQLKEREREPFTDEEQAMLWKSYDQGNENAAIPLIMIATGMMTGEMRRLKKSMIDLDNRVIKGAGIKTNVRKKLSIVLPDDICPILEDIMEKAEGDMLYPITETAFYSRYYKALEDAGIKRHLTPYSCRHTTATRHTITEHTPPQVVARIMRWSSTKMMDRYVHVSDSEAIEAANAISRPKKP